ncbi:MAG: DUF1127 domain-containing protein [Sneathiella sp.]|nr:DUF1127 domain-containing protein [Sneathiella sp.]
MNILSTKTTFAAGKFQRAALVALTSVEKLYEAARQKHMSRKTAAALSVLDDHELADIGLIRSDIGQIAKRAYH